MASSTIHRHAAIGAFAAFAVALPAVSMAQFVISASIAPPPLPVYVQPALPGDGYLWSPGYWAYGSDGYYWVPGVWVRPPRIGYLWTPPYWGFAGGLYGFHPGYWGPRVGYYGGINYGYGYGGAGFVGGRWQGNVFAYNTAVSRVNVNVRNTYVENVTQVTTARASFNGGPGGIRARPSDAEARAERERHIAATPAQQQHFQAAQQNRAQYASTNNGRPETAAMASPRQGFNRADRIEAREGNQQARIGNGTRDGRITPGEERRLQRREGASDQTVRSDRAARDGAWSTQERRQVDRRQDRVGRSIAVDRHNADNDIAAAERHGRAPGQERHEAQQIRRAEAPRRPQRGPQQAPHQGPQHEHH